MVVVFSVGYWALQHIDGEAEARERRSLVAGLAQSQAKIPIEQEGIAIWDDAVLNLRAGNLPWITENLITWLQTFYAHDRVYVVASNGSLVGDPLDAGGKPSGYDPRDLTAVTSLVQDMRAMMAAASGAKLDSTTSVMGLKLSDTVLLSDGQPAFVSVRPIVPSSSAVPQAPGEEYVHVSVKLVAGQVLDDIGSGLQIADLRVGGLTGKSAALPLTDRHGRIVGILSWSPVRPALSFLILYAPALLGILAVGGLGFAGFLFWLSKTTAKLEASRARVKHMAFHDPLTGLPNRAMFEVGMRKAIAFRTLANTKVAVVTVDLDGFKEINDTWGHAAGDELLRQVAERLRSCVSEDGLVARLGGDEFAIVEPGMSSEGHALWVCQDYARKFEQSFNLGLVTVDVTASFGLTLADRELADTSEMQRQADLALYSAKMLGRNRVELYERSLDTSRRDKRALEIDLRNALVTSCGLYLVYQPIFGVETGLPAGAEALVRWQHPERGGLGPDLFIPLAEETRLINDLGRWVLNEACRYAAATGIPWVAVNVSPIQLRSLTFADEVATVLARLGLQPHRLELEITEGVLLLDSPQVRANLAALRATGIRIALDDFGTGYSSVSYLRSYQIDKLKIDRSFVDGLGEDPTTDALMRLMIETAKTLGMSVTAEGVEDDQQRRLLEQLGCTYLQGYLMSKPLLASACLKLFQSSSSSVSMSKALAVT